MQEAPLRTPDDSIRLEAESDVRALGVTRARAWTITVLGMLALAVTLVDRQALAAVAVHVTRDLAISDVAYGWLSSGFAGGYLLGSLPSARIVQRFGPRLSLFATVAIASIAIALHGFVDTFAALFVLRVVLGLAVAPAFAAAAQAVHFVLPFKDRSRGIGILYMGNSLGSAICPPLTVALASGLGWRRAFVCVGVLGLAWLPLWIPAAFVNRARATLDALSTAVLRTSGVLAKPVPIASPLTDVLRNPAALRAAFVVAASTPVTTVMLLWGAKYLVSDHGLDPNLVGRYLWLPPTLFGASALLFGELRARSTRTRSRARPPRRLVLVAALLSACIAAVPLAHDPMICVMLASVAMAGSGGLFTLATSDMLAHTRAGVVPVATTVATITQCLVHVVVSPIIGMLVVRFGNYDRVMTAAGLWIIPGVAFWFAHASFFGARRPVT